MFWLKACSRCGGDLYVDGRNDDSGFREKPVDLRWATCLQCGCEVDLKANRVLEPGPWLAPWVTQRTSSAEA